MYKGTAMDEQDFIHWCQKLNLSEQAENAIRHIRSSEPSRAVQSGRGSVSGRYPSRKMGVTIQFESHKNELAWVHTFEHDDDVIEYYDQPPAIKLEYEAANGRRLGVFHTPDYFVIRSGSAGWEECKTEEQLTTLAERSPNRHYKDEDGVWRCPPGEAVAHPLGLYYRLRSSREINWTLQRNIEFLDDYYRTGEPAIKDEARTVILSCVRSEPGITLPELFSRTAATATRDDVFMLVAHEEVYVDLAASSLRDAAGVQLFADRETAAGFRHSAKESAGWNRRHTIDTSIGSIIQWDGRGWMVANIGETTLSLTGEKDAFIELPISTFEKLVREGRIAGVEFKQEADEHPEVKRRLSLASKDDFAEANRRMLVVKSVMHGTALPEGVEVDNRTIRRWKALYRAAQEAYGNPYIGLLPRPNMGNGRDKLPSPTKVLLEEFIEKDYETLKQKPKFEVYATYVLTCGRRGIMPASYKTFCKAIKQRPQYAQTLRRQGRKAAYKHQPIYLELELTTPRHGDRPWHISHIDHTQLDVELVCSITGENLGRPWLTLLTDAYSRRILAIHLTFDPPSYRSCMMLLRECVRRHGRLPQIIVLDGGKEFSSVYFEILLARYECTKKIRPPAEARFGSVCERLFGTTNTRFVHNLLGNTQIMRNVRQVTKSVNPKTLAVWTLERLHAYLCEWAYEVYDTIDHPALGTSPRNAYAAGMATSGERLHRLIPYDEQFKMLTRPTTRKGTAMVYTGRGVKINNIYYWADCFREPGVERTSVDVRYDPWDAGMAYALVKRQWVQCYSEHYATLRGRSEREIMLASKELHRRLGRHSQRFNITAAKLARFLESAEAEEVLLRQRMADREARHLWEVIDGGSSSPALLPQAVGSPAGAGETRDGVNELPPPKAALEIYGEF
jgi:putative transposase